MCMSSDIYVHPPFNESGHGPANGILYEDQTKTSSISSFSLMILTVSIQWFSMLEGNVMCIQEHQSWPAIGIIGCSFDAVCWFSANLRFCVGTLEFTFDLLQYSGRFLVLDKIGNLCYMRFAYYGFVMLWSHHLPVCWSITRHTHTDIQIHRMTTLPLRCMCRRLIMAKVSCTCDDPKN